MELYTAYRFYKESNRKPTVMKRNLTLDKARKFVSQYESTPRSFVGFSKN